MKKSKIIFETLIMLMLFFTCLIGQERLNPYKFPLKPGDEGWKSLKTHVEKVNVIQIPDSILVSLTTGDLIQTCMNYPLFIDMFAFNSSQYGFNKIMNDFNGFKELFNC